MSEKLLIRNNGFPFKESVSAEPVTRFVTRVEYAARTYEFPEGCDTPVDADVAHYVQSIHGGHGLNIVHPEAEAALAVEREEKERKAAEALAAAPSIATAAGAVPAPLGERADGTVILRQDGPTFEQYVAAGGLPETYPPEGYEAKDTEGRRAYEAERAEAEAKAQVDKAGAPPAAAPEHEPEPPAPAKPSTRASRAATKKRR
jgi:hypothetical protein